MDILGDFSHEERGEVLPASGSGWRIGRRFTAVGLAVFGLMMVRHFV